MWRHSRSQQVCLHEKFSVFPSVCGTKWALPSQKQWCWLWGCIWEIKQVSSLWMLYEVFCQSLWLFWIYWMWFASRNIYLFCLHQDLQHLNWCAMFNLKLSTVFVIAESHSWHALSHMACVCWQCSQCMLGNWTSSGVTPNPCDPYRGHRSVRVSQMTQWGHT